MGRTCGINPVTAGSSRSKYDTHPLRLGKCYAEPFRTVGYRPSSNGDPIRVAQAHGDLPLSWANLAHRFRRRIPTEEFVASALPAISPTLEEKGNRGGSLGLFLRYKADAARSLHPIAHDDA